MLGLLVGGLVGLSRIHFLSDRELVAPASLYGLALAQAPPAEPAGTDFLRRESGGRHLLVAGYGSPRAGVTLVATRTRVVAATALAEAGHPGAGRIVHEALCAERPAEALAVCVRTGDNLTVLIVAHGMHSTPAVAALAREAWFANN